ncbi:MAG: hypothetical protein ABI939_07070, partial [Anaerolineaceae bacterium]
MKSLSFTVATGGAVVGGAAGVATAGAAADTVLVGDTPLGATGVIVGDGVAGGLVPATVAAAAGALGLPSGGST